MEGKKSKECPYNSAINTMPVSYDGTKPTYSCTSLKRCGSCGWNPEVAKLRSEIANWEYDEARKVIYLDIKGISL